jgi:hypothetical protein
MAVRELTSSGSKAGNALRIRAGLRICVLHWHTGTVTGYESGTVAINTAADQDFHRDARSNYTQRPNLHERVTLTDSRGDRVLQVNDAFIDPVEGHVLTAVWAVSRPGTTVDCVLFFDRTQPKTVAVEAAIRRLLSHRPLMLVLLPAVAIIGALIATRWPGPCTACALALLIAGALIAALVRSRVDERRVRRFIEQDAPSILAAIEAAEARLAGPLATPART